MLCRPSDMVLDLLPSKLTTNFDREGGTPFLSDYEIQPGDELEDAMEGAGLPVADLVGPARAYYRYTRLDGEVVGYGGFELYGQDALFRSLAVTGRFHRQGNGRNIALLLMSRAFARGARNAFALPATLDSEVFMSKLGFAEIDRAGAPAAITETRQVSDLCRTARFFHRRIAL